MSWEHTNIIDRFDEEQHNFPTEHDLGPHPVTQVVIRSYHRKKPFWMSKDGQVFEIVEDIEDEHLLNLITFLAARAHGLDQLMKTLDDDLRETMKGNAEIIREKTRACIEEAAKRKLLV